MEPKPGNKMVYKLNISWTQDCNGWVTPGQRREINKLCDRLYVSSASQHTIKALEEVDQRVTGDEQPEALELIMSAYNKHKNNPI